MEILGAILFFIYVGAGYWATGQTIYANKIIIAAPGQLSLRKTAYGMMFGWILIPVALIKNYSKKKS
jgi:hypothetical protein